MITSIKVKGMYNIGVNESNNIDINGTNVSLKDIPFVRYEFDKYDTDEVNYIKESMNKFIHSTHLLQFKVGESLLTDLNNTIELHNNVAKYVYADIIEENVGTSQLNADTIIAIQQAYTVCRFDRFMLVDKTASLDMANAKKIIKHLSTVLGVNESKIGICSSPLCMSDNLACLTAVTARELAAIYATSKEIVSPSANHQDMNCCGCMRFFVVDKDIEAPAGKVKKVKEKAKDKDGDTPEKAKKTTTKVAKPTKYYIDDFI